VVATFLVEAYEPRGGAGALAALEGRARDAARARGVRYVRSIFTPQDELCLHVFESSSRERLEQALAAAGFGYVRVTEAAELPLSQRGRAEARARQERRNR
jgi:hypothetical protein